MPLPGCVVEGRRTRAASLTRPLKDLAGWVALLGSLAGCGGTDPRIPTTLSLNSNSVAFTSLGQTQQLSPSIADQDGKPLLEASVTWTSSNEQVATVSQNGLVTAAGAGTATITATAGSASATAQVDVTQTPTEIEKVSGDGQAALAGETLTAPLVVQVNDAGGNPIPGATVTFEVAEGQGNIGTASVTTGADGRASTTYTTGTVAGSVQAVRATVATTALSVSFSAIAEPDPTSFNIGVRFVSSATATQRQAFTAAKLRWEAIITDDLEDGFLQASAGTCGSGSPAVNQDVDDVVILVNLVAIDGAGGVLGAAGPCYVRDFAPLDTFAPGDLPVLGTMRFDTADLEMLEANGLLTDVILHEMGHVLGIGSLWWDYGFLADPSFPEPPPAPSNPDADPHFTGSQAIAAFDDMGGAAYLGAKVPVENTGGRGNADGHWRESVLENELMTGFIGAGQNPLSRLTIASLADEGYAVDLSAADPYDLLPSLHAFGSQQKLELKNDIFQGPIRKVDSRGRITGMLRR